MRAQPERSMQGRQIAGDTMIITTKAVSVAGGARFLGSAGPIERDR